MLCCGKAGGAARRAHTFLHVPAEVRPHASQRCCAAFQAGALHCAHLRGVAGPVLVMKTGARCLRHRQQQ